MPTHLAYLKRIAPVYCRFEPDSRYLRVQFAKKLQFVSEFEVPMPLFGRVKRSQIGLHWNHWLIKTTD